jgi:hypothetical protein
MFKGIFLKSRKEKIEMRKNIVFSVFIILVLAFVIGCGGGGSAEDKIIGKWGVDIDSLMETPEIKAQLESMPEMEDMMKEMFATMTFEITKEEIKVNAMGSEESMPYTIVSSTSDSVDIEIEGETNTIKIIDNSKIEIQLEDQSFVLKKQ